VRTSASAFLTSGVMEQACRTANTRHCRGQVTPIACFAC
jgi:hypothetical protein